MNDALWTLFVLLWVAVPCALVGYWLVLRRESMVGDGISHGVLPGIVIAFLVTNTRTPLPMLVGATAAGLATVCLTHSLSRVRFVPKDAALGAVFTTMFALGVLILTRAAGQVDLDPGCVLYGLAEFIPLSMISIGSASVPASLVTVVPLGLVALVGLALARRELALATFDPAHARLIGRRPDTVGLLLLGLATVLIVGAFEAVGSVLVVALLVGPGLAALRLTSDRARAAWLSAFLALVAVVVGYFGAVALNSSLAGMIAVVCGAMFVVASVLTHFLSSLVGSLSNS